jgi:hypothetical protein
VQAMKEAVRSGPFNSIFHMNDVRGIGMGRSKTEDSSASLHRQSSDGSPPDISRSQTSLNRDVYFSRRRMSHSIHCDIIGFIECSALSGGNATVHWDLFHSAGAK